MISRSMDICNIEQGIKILFPYRVHGGIESQLSKALKE